MRRAGNPLEEKAVGDGAGAHAWVDQRPNLAPRYYKDSIETTRGGATFPRFDPRYLHIFTPRMHHLSSIASTFFGGIFKRSRLS